MNYKLILKEITTFVFDVDGVLTDGTVTVLPNEEPIRIFNAKDGYALQLAVKKGYNVAIITGGKSMAVKQRLESLGIKDIWIGQEDRFGSGSGACTGADCPYRQATADHC